jgi:hypothetical protein
MSSLRRRRLAAAFAIALSAALLAAPRLSACSICRCGDPTFNALGSNIYSAGRFTLAFDWDHLSKEQGVFGEELGFATRALGRAAQTQEVEESRREPIHADRFLFVRREVRRRRAAPVQLEDAHGEGTRRARAAAFPIRSSTASFASGHRTSGRGSAGGRGSRRCSA